MSLARRDQVPSLHTWERYSEFYPAPLMGCLVLKLLISTDWIVYASSICCSTGRMQGCFTSFLSFVLQLSAFVCSGLQKLLLQNNQLSRLPEDLNSLKQLQEVLVDGNPMTDPPIEVCSQGTSAILQYLWQKRHKKAKASKVGVLKQPQCTYVCTKQCF